MDSISSVSAIHLCAPLWLEENPVGLGFVSASLARANTFVWLLPGISGQAGERLAWTSPQRMLYKECKTDASVFISPLPPAPPVAVGVPVDVPI